jgi:hypothetical protein
MEPLIAFCGVSCEQCPAYVATQAGDEPLLAEVLAEWRAFFQAPHITLADILCDGCPTEGGRLNGYCRQCAIRPCALGRGLSSCAHCDDYACDELSRLLDLCDNLEGFFGYARQARATLEGIRAGASL